MTFSLTLLELIVFLIGTLALIPNITGLFHKKIDSILFIYPIFYLFYILPLLFDVLFGVPSFGKFVGLKKAYEVSTAQYIYAYAVLLFILCIWLLYQINCKRKQNRVERFKEIKSDHFILILMLLPVVYLFFNPVYFKLFLKGYGAQYSHGLNLLFPEILTQLGLCGSILYIVSPKRRKRQLLFGMFAAFLCVFFNGKRYLAMWAIIYILFALIISKKLNIKKAFLSIIFLFPIILLYLFIYTFMIKTSSLDLNSLLRMYLGRDYTVVASISWRLTNDPVLEYPGQSLLFYFLFFIPRKLFPAKPWPYSQYNSRMCFGYSAAYTDLLDETVTSGIIAEFIANFGIILGIALSFLLLFGLIIFSNHVKLLETKIFIIVIIAILFMSPSGMIPALSVTWAVLYMSYVCPGIRIASRYQQ